MHDALRQRLLRRIESLPDAQVYQVLDFIEFLESKYAGADPVEATGLQKFAESLEDKLRKKAVSPNTIREAFQLISAADRVLHGVSSAGKQVLADLNQALDVPEGEGEPGSGTPPSGGASGRGGARESRPSPGSSSNRTRSRTDGGRRTRPEGGSSDGERARDRSEEDDDTPSPGSGTGG